MRTHCLHVSSWMWPGLVVIVGVCTAMGAPAQVSLAPGRPVQWRAGAWQPAATSIAQVEQDLQRLAQARGGGHFVIQFAQPVTPQQRAALGAAGLRLLGYLGSDAYFARIETAEFRATAVTQIAKVSAVSPIELQWKLQPLVARGEFPPYSLVDTRNACDPTVAVYVLLHEDVPPAALAGLAGAHGAAVRSTLVSIPGAVFELPASEIPRLAAEDAVQWIEAPLLFEPWNDSSRALTQAETAQAPPYDLDGSGVRVLVFDSGTVHEEHPDFGNRVIVPDSDPPGSHPTHVAGTVGGSGLQSGGQFRGMAPAVEIVSYSYVAGHSGIFLYNDPGDMEHDYREAIGTWGVDLATNSIGTNVCRNGFACEMTGDYCLMDTLIDTAVRGGMGRPLPVFWAQGNERACYRCRDEGVSTPEGYRSIPPPGAAKNSIGIGALNSNDDTVTYFSSWGPCDDGRTKPDVCAPGCQTGGDHGVTSTKNGDGYVTYCGTSMASPAAAGCGALLIQDLRAQFPMWPAPRGSTVKALLAHNALDLGNPGPDYQSGYGSIRIQHTIDFMRTGHFYEGEVEHGASAHFLIDVVSSAQPLVVTMAWDDVPGTPNTIPALVNDLDLVVVDPGGDRHYPWTLDPDNPGAPAVRVMTDHINNMEQVRVDNPVTGVWSVVVLGYNVPAGPQVFSMAGSPGLSRDCDDNGIPDEVQIAADPGLDCTGNGLLDVCEPDCNNNGRADSCDIAQGSSVDCEPNGIPDECEPDCNANGVADACDISGGSSQDCDGNGVPDECQDTSADCNHNGIWDTCDIAQGTSTDMNENGVPDECELPGTVIYVDDCAGQGTGSLADPYCKIQYALDLAAPGALIIVRDGVYQGPGNVALDFHGKELTLVSESGPAQCIIDGGNTARCFYFSSYETPAAHVEGFTIRHGFHFLMGGGVYIENASPTIVNCVIRDNQAMGFMGGGLGGGLFSYISGSPKLIGCVFEGNYASDGAGAHNMSDGCTYERCIFRDNRTTFRGGGLESYGAGVVIVRDSVFERNEAASAEEGAGGAAYFAGTAGSMTLRNCTFLGNHATRAGAVILASGGASLTVQNCIAWGNTSDGGANVQLEFEDAAGGHLDVSYSDIEGGEAAVSVCPASCTLNWAAGNIDADPLFFEDPPYNFRIQPNSPAVDTGDPDFIPGPGETAFDGQPRVQNGRVDMGADESMADCNRNGVPDYQDIANGTSRDDNGNGIPDECEAPPVCRGDCDCDGRVNFSDIDLFVAAIPDDPVSWAALYAARHGGAQPTCPFGNCDTNGDGHVNFADIDPFVALIPSMCP